MSIVAVGAGARDQPVSANIHNQQVEGENMAYDFRVLRRGYGQCVHKSLRTQVTPYPLWSLRTHGLGHPIHSVPATVPNLFNPQEKPIIASNTPSM